MGLQGLIWLYRFTSLAWAVRGTLVRVNNRGFSVLA